MESNGRSKETKAEKVEFHTLPAAFQEFFEMASHHKRIDPGTGAELSGAAGFWETLTEIDKAEYLSSWEDNQKKKSLSPRRVLEQLTAVERNEVSFVDYWRNLSQDQQRGLQNQYLLLSDEEKQRIVSSKKDIDEPLKLSETKREAREAKTDRKRGPAAAAAAPAPAPKIVESKTMPLAILPGEITETRFPYLGNFETNPNSTWTPSTSDIIARTGLGGLAWIDFEADEFKQGYIPWKDSKVMGVHALARGRFAVVVEVGYPRKHYLAIMNPRSIIEDPTPLLLESCDDSIIRNICTFPDDESLFLIVETIPMLGSTMEVIRFDEKPKQLIQVIPPTILLNVLKFVTPFASCNYIWTCAFVGNYFLQVNSGAPGSEYQLKLSHYDKNADIGTRFKNMEIPIYTESLGCGHLYRDTGDFRKTYQRNYQILPLPGGETFLLIKDDNYHGGVTRIFNLFRIEDDKLIEQLFPELPAGCVITSHCNPCVLSSGVVVFLVVETLASPPTFSLMSFDPADNSLKPIKTIEPGTFCSDLFVTPDGAIGIGCRQGNVTRCDFISLPPTPEATLEMKKLLHNETKLLHPLAKIVMEYNPFFGSSRGIGISKTPIRNPNDAELKPILGNMTALKLQQDKRNETFRDLKPQARQEAIAEAELIEKLLVRLDDLLRNRPDLSYKACLKEVIKEFPKLDLKFIFTPKLDRDLNPRPELVRVMASAIWTPQEASNNLITLKKLLVSVADLSNLRDKPTHIKGRR